MAPEPPLVLLDACCVINLLASGVAAEILSAVPVRFGVADLVLERDVLHVPTEPAGEQESAAAADATDPDRPYEHVDLGPLVDAGLIEVMSLTSEDEYATFVAMAADLDDGEAVTGALAVHHGAEVATDDRKAIRVLTGWDPPVRVRRTSQLLRVWTDNTKVAADEVRNAIERIERLASFIPPRDDPHRMWWLQVRNSSTIKAD